MRIVRDAHQVPHGQQRVELEEQDRGLFHPLGILCDIFIALGRVLLAFRSPYLADTIVAECNYSSYCEEAWRKGLTVNGYIRHCLAFLGPPEIALGIGESIYVFIDFFARGPATRSCSEICSFYMRM
jgi:hypothetical protein